MAAVANLALLPDAVSRPVAKAAGRALMALSGVSSFDIARHTHETRGLPTTPRDANAEYTLAGTALRDRPHELVQNSPYAKRAIDAHVARVIGRGIWPVFAKKEANDLFEKWAPVCYTHNRTGWEGLQTLAERTRFSSGAAWGRRRWRKTTDKDLDGRPLAVPLQIQLYEQDQVDTTKEVPPDDSGRRTMSGVEYDGVGRPVAVWFYRDHPGSIVATRLESVRVPYSDLAHLYREDRPNQIHGVPDLSSVAMSLWKLDKYENSELTRKWRESNTVAIVAGGEEDPNADDADDRTAFAVKDADGNVVEEWGDGQILYAFGDRQISFHQPATVGGYAEYVTKILHKIAAGLNLPYYTLSGDLSQYTYASAQIGDNDAQAHVRPWQEQGIVPMFLQVIVRWFVEAAVASGALTGAVEDYSVVEWQYPVREVHDRVEAIKADFLEMRSVVTTLEDVLAARGRNLAKVIESAKRVAEALDGAKLVSDADTRKVTQNGMLQTAPRAPAPAA